MANIPVADDWTRYRRFLCMGREGAKYTSNEDDPARSDVQAMKNLIEQGKGIEVVHEIKHFAVEGRAVKHKPAIFALAICAKDPDVKEVKVKQEAYKILEDVLKIPTHLFLFLFYCHTIVRECSDDRKRPVGWGRSSRTAVSRWYNEKDAVTLAMHVSKYMQRHRWSHRDILRMAHVKPKTKELALVFRYAAKGGFKSIESMTKKEKEEMGEDEKAVFDYLEAVNELKHTQDQARAVYLIEKHDFVREQVPTWLHNSVEVWTALLEKMPMTAMLRNLGKMSALGMLGRFSTGSSRVVERLKDSKRLKNSKVHPFCLLVSLQAYKAGKGDKGKHHWDVNEEIKIALEEAFYQAFEFVSPTNKRFLVAVDVSPSMGFGDVNGMPRVTPSLACAAFIKLLKDTETEHPPTVVGFSTSDSQGHIEAVDIKPKDNLDDIQSKMSSVTMGDVNPAQAIEWAQNKKLPVDVFLVLTDLHTHIGAVKPKDALVTYREAMAIPDAKLITVAMTASSFTIADPNDRLMLDVVGCDANVPSVIYSFVHDDAFCNKIGKSGETVNDTATGSVQMEAVADADSNIIEQEAAAGDGAVEEKMDDQPSPQK